MSNALALMTYLTCRDRCKSVFKTLLSTRHQHRDTEFLSKHMALVIIKHMIATR